MPEGFGRRLRALRVQRGLSQAALGGTRYSAGYISHLESGRRQPTTEVVSYIAARLDVCRDELEAPAQGAVDVARLLDLELMLSQSWRDGDLDAVEAAAEELAGVARNVGREEVWWRASLEMARVLALRGDLATSSELLSELNQHPLVEQSSLIAAEALNLTSAVLRSQGRLVDALQIAHRSTAITSALPSGSSRRMRALTLAVELHTALGNNTEATNLAETLLAEVGQSGSVQMQGCAHWSASDAFLAAGATDRGLRHLRAAGELISPEADAFGWGRFVRAACYRLALADLHTELERWTHLMPRAPKCYAADEAAMERVATVVARFAPKDLENCLGELRACAKASSTPMYIRAEVALKAADLLYTRGKASDRPSIIEVAQEASLMFREAGAPWRALAALDLATLADRSASEAQTHLH